MTANSKPSAFVPAFPKPAFDFPDQAAAEIAALRKYRQTKPGRAVPAKAANRLLLVTWNIANLGVQQRRQEDYQVLAEILGWFDLAAVQEVNQNRAGLDGILRELPSKYRTIFSDTAGNNERMAFLYDSAKVKPIELVGEVAIPPADLKDVKLPGVTQQFEGFDRNPYLAAFQAGTFRFTLVNVHLYFGNDSEKTSIERRSLEAFAVARWADLEVKSKYAYTPDIIALGDFNLPKAEAGNPVFDALTRRGLHLPGHSTQIGSNLAGDKDYDQVAFFPGETNDEFTGQSGVFDFDGAVFQKLWQTKTEKQFQAYVKYYLSDHRPLWVEFKI